MVKTKRQQSIGKNLGASSNHPNPAAPPPQAACSGTPSDALFGNARVSTLLSLLHRLLIEHELKLTLCLLESLADSKISVSSMSVQALELQKALLTFCGARRKLPTQHAGGIHLIEDLCMSSSFGKAEGLERKGFNRSKTIGTSSLDASDQPKNRHSNKCNSGHGKLGGAEGSAKHGLLSAPKASQSQPNSCLHTPSTSLPASRNLTPRASVLSGDPRLSICSTKLAGDVRAPEAHASQGSRETSEGSSQQDSIVEVGTCKSARKSAEMGESSIGLTRMIRIQGPLPKKNRNGSLCSLDSATTVVPGVPEHNSFDHKTQRIRPSVDNEKATFAQMPLISAWHVPPTLPPTLDLTKDENGEPSPPMDCKGSAKVRDISEADADTSERKDQRYFSEPSMVDGASVKSGAPEVFAHRPLCPYGDHEMDWIATADEYDCYNCGVGLVGKLWHCEAHAVSYCMQCLDDSSKLMVAGASERSVVADLASASPSFNPEIERDDVSLKSPKDFYEDGSTSGSEYEERQEVRWADELDDLSAMQVAWLATPTDRLMQHPNSIKRMTWDVIALLFIVMDCILLPMKFCFSIEPPSWSTWIFSVFFTMDIVLNFNTGYFHGSILILRRSMVVRNYLATWFLLDFIATFPWEEVITIFAGSDGTSGGEHTILRMAKLSRYMRCVRLLRVMKVQKLMDRFQEMQIFNEHNSRFALSIVQMLSIFGMLCHWAACIFGIIGEPGTFNLDADNPHDYIKECVPGGPCEAGIMGTPWRHRYGLDNYGLSDQYLMALHFATGLVTGGELALQPGFWMERIYVVVMMITGLFVCSAVLSHVLVLITKKAEENIEANEQVWAVKKYMMLRKVAPELQGKVRRYLETQTKLKEEGNDYDALDHLSPALRTELIEHLNRKVITKHPFFAEMSEEAIQSVCVQAVPTIAGPGDIVVEKGQLALSMDFVVRGKLKVEGMQKNVYLAPGSWLGDRCLFVDTQRTHTVTAVISSEVLCVQKRTVVAVCSEYPHMQTHYDQFQKRICDGENILLCSICRQPGHSQEDCPDHPDRVSDRVTNRGSTKSCSKRNSSNTEEETGVKRSFTLTGLLSKSTVHW